MADDADIPESFDWGLTTFEGARREQLRRWAALPLEDIVRALEEMEEVARELGMPPDGRPAKVRDR